MLKKSLLTLVSTRKLNNKGRYQVSIYLYIFNKIIIHNKMFKNIINETKITYFLT